MLSNNKVLYVHMLRLSRVLLSPIELRQMSSEPFNQSIFELNQTPAGRRKNRTCAVHTVGILEDVPISLIDVRMH